MAYLIFLKYLRILEEFRKNPHVKIPPKSPQANFQSLGKFKNPIFNSKIIFLRFRPDQPYGPLGLSPSQPHWLLSSHGLKPPLPAHLARASVASSWKYVFPFCSHLPSQSLLSHLSIKWARAVSFIFLPHRPTVAASSCCLWPPRATQPPTARSQVRSSLHALIPPPLISPLNHSSSHPTINGIKTITASPFPLPRHGVPLPGHYIKARSTPPAITTLTSPSIVRFRVRNIHPTERLLCRLFPTVSRSCPTLCRPLLQPVRLTAVPSPFSLNRGEVPRTGPPFRPFSGEPPPRR
jgi:hypothetical protein